jgi:predicted metal-dependent hydrolase
MIKPKKIIRSKRKSIALVVNGDGELIVRAPYYLDKSTIMRFVKEKQNWLQRQCSTVQEAKSRFCQITMSQGEVVKFLGEDYTINLCEVDNIMLLDSCIKVPLTCSCEQFKEWFKSRALVLLPKRVEHYAAIMGVVPQKIKLSGARTRWGSCSFSNNINLAWHLIMCPPEVIDYVVVHELCHIINKSHNKLFWKLVADILPDYREQEKWLKTNRKLMEIL